MRVRTSLFFILLGLLPLTVAQSHGQSIRSGWGATPYHDAAGNGVTFRVWAPNAISVFVPGQFNNWSTTATPLRKETPSGVWNGNWSADVPNASPGQEYKYYINYAGGAVWKRDPRGRKVVNSASNSIIYDPAAFNWAGDVSPQANLNELVIYEMHAGTFYDPNPGDSQPGKLTDAVSRLSYLKNLGVNAVEVMPICEFPGDRSWGYNPCDIFAVENTAYGGPDAFKTFVKACHANGIAVLLDVVHNHYGPSDLDLWNFDGFSGNNSLGGGGIYFYESNENLQVTPWGYTRPNFASAPVRQFIKDNFQMWLDEYRVDGFRWDTPGAMMTANDGSAIGSASTLITEINSFIHTNYANKISIAEDRQSNGFDSAWDTTFPYALRPILAETVDANRDIKALTNALASNVRYGGAAGLKRVAFLESHDVVGDQNGGVRLPAAIDSSNPASFRARKLSLLGAALTFTAPGIPMIFQGEEMLENQPFSDTRPVDWTKTNSFKGIVNCHRDLIALRRNLSGGIPGLLGDRISFLLADNTSKVVAYHRWQNVAPTQDAVVVANLSGVTRTISALSFPRAGNWYVYFNSDSPEYSSDFTNVGTNLVIASGATPTGRVVVGPYSAIVMSQRPLVPTLSTEMNGKTATISWPASYAGWTLQTSASLDANAIWEAAPFSEYRTNANTVSVDIGFDSPAFYRLRKSDLP